MICYVLFVLSILLSVLGRGEGATAAYKPTDVFLFNCGGTYDQLDNNGRYWTAESDETEFLSSSSVNASFPSVASSIESSVPAVPYMTARIFRSKFTYSFHVSSRWEFLRLYFYPTPYVPENLDVVTNSFFSVTVNNFTLLRDFSPGLTVKASKPESKYLIKEFIVPVDKILNLTFTPSHNSVAFVNGIEIVSMPDRFYSKGGFDDVITNVGSTADFQIDSTTAFETVYRLNAGAEMVGDVGDSGMFRRWLSDDEYIPNYLIDSTTITPIIQHKKINYTKKTPAYVAPEAVYATSRSMFLGFNLTWLFTVDAGFNYLVRLHLCDTFQVTKTGQRVFSIFLDNQTATLETDVFRLAGGSWIPMYLDYNVIVGLGSGPRHDLRLDLHPLNQDNPTSRFYPILNGIEILKRNNPDGNLAGPNPHPKPKVSTVPTPNRESMDDGTIKGMIYILVKIVIPIFATGLALTFMLIIRKRMMKNRKTNNSVVMMKVLLKHYTYAELKKITKSFSHTVGKGGFGTVYGGNLSNGRKVAVKVLKDLTGNGEDFINEVASMSQTSHVNIVSLLGFCYETSKRAIVYEFLENGSLDQFISRNITLTQDVNTLYGIALGIARGLEYLHYGCKTRIVHFDIKPQNILLDENLCPKVSDFGLAKLCEKRESILSLMDARGTIGYIAPEVFSRMYGRVSHKSDVYSYGMLLFEMIGARNKEIVETTASDTSSAYFPDWIYKGLENEKQPWIFGDEITNEEKEIAKKISVVGLWCIQTCPSDRPPMNRVVEMMEGSLDALEVPPKPSMHISTEIIPESSSLSDDGEVE